MTVLNLNGKNTYFADPHWNNVVLFLENDKIDQSGKSLGWQSITGTVNTDPTENALYFDGLSCIQILNYDLEYTTNEDYTIDFWVKHIEYKQHGLFQLIYKYLDGTYNYDGLNNFKMNYYAFETGYGNNNTGDVYFSENNRGGIGNDVPFNGIDSNWEWDHIAIVRKYDSVNNLNFIKIFVNGVDSGFYDLSSPIPVGRFGSANQEYPANGDYATPSGLAIVLGRTKPGVTETFFKGYLKYFRFTRGIARFTENFDPQSLFDLQPLTALYYGNTLVEKLYKGDVQLYPSPVDPSNGDPFWDNVELYIKGDGVLEDISYNPKTITTNNGAIISTTQKKYGNSSLYNPENGFTNVSGITLGTGNFTIEFWLYPVTVGYAWRICSFGRAFQEGQMVVICNHDAPHTKIKVYNPYAGNSTSNTYAMNAWNHIALVKSSNNFKIYINGTEGLSFADSKNYNYSTFSIGGEETTRLQAYFDSIRITKGIVRYTTSFNPETDTYLAY